MEQQSLAGDERVAQGILALAVLGVKGSMAVRRFEWMPDGTWHLECVNGVCETGQLAGATATLGPWILLAWNVGADSGNPLKRRYALIGVSEAGPEAFRTLRGRLSVLRGGSSRTSGALPGPGYAPR